MKQSLMLVVCAAASGCANHAAPASDLGPPASAPTWVQVPNLGGSVIAAPEIVTITWSGDPLAASLQAFDAWLVQSDYFRKSLAEYGVAAGKQAVVFSVPVAAPATLDDTDIGKLLVAKIADGTLPPPTANRIYDVYPAPGTAITQIGEKGCVDFQGFHDVTKTANGALVVYIVVPRCASATLDDVTLVASHEIAEAATDPSGDPPAWLREQSDALTPNGGEIGDLCAGHPLTIENHSVTAIYSNSAAAADQRWCVPAPLGPNFAAVPTPNQLTIAPGQTASTTVRIHASVPVSGLALDIYSYDEQVAVTPAHAIVAQDDSLTLTLTAASPGTHIVELSLSDNDYRSSMFVLVSTQPAARIDSHTGHQRRP